MLRHHRVIVSHWPPWAGGPPRFDPQSIPGRARAFKRVSTSWTPSAHCCDFGRTPFLARFSPYLQGNAPSQLRVWLCNRTGYFSTKQPGSFCEAAPHRSRSGQSVFGRAERCTSLRPLQRRSGSGRCSSLSRSADRTKIGSSPLSAAVAKPGEFFATLAHQVIASSLLWWLLCQPDLGRQVLFSDRSVGPFDQIKPERLTVRRSLSPMASGCDPPAGVPNTALAVPPTDRCGDNSGEKNERLKRLTDKM